MNKTQHINTIKTPLLVFGGVYSNLEALQSLCKKAEELSIPSSQIICTGDIVGYCADPDSCVQFIKEWDIHSITGNVELNLIDGADDCGCNFNEGSRCDVFSKQWYPYALAQLSEESKKYLKTLPQFISFRLGGKKCFVVHGSYHNTSEFIFESTSWNIKNKNFQDANSDIIIAGHCGLPFLQKNKNHLWMNPGVIGMPANDGSPKVWYGIIQENNKKQFSFELHQLEYLHQKAAHRMRENHLPISYAETLETGIWDNCEILPQEETKKQGKEIKETTVIF